MEVGGFQALGRLGYLSGLTPAGFFTAGRVHQAFTLLSLPWLFTNPAPLSSSGAIHRPECPFVFLFVCFVTGS